MRKSAVFVTLVALLVGYQMMPSRASSHREAPLISADPQADTTDVYAFVSPDAPDTVTLISSWSPFEDPAGGPNFFKFGDNVLYNFNIDNDGDSVADIVYQFDFTSTVRNPNTFLYNTDQVTALDDPDRNLSQTYTVTRFERGHKVFTSEPMLTMYDNVGYASTPNYGSTVNGVYSFQQGGKENLVFAGQTDDAFFLDLRIFDLLYGANLSETGTDSLAGFNVHSIALRVPKSALLSSTSPIFGVWATSSRPSTTLRKKGGVEQGAGHQVIVSRLGMPLVNEVVIPIGDKDVWNGSEPSDDEQFLKYVLEPEVPKLLQKIYGIPAPPTPRNDLVAVFLTGVPNLNQPMGVKASEMIRLNTDIAPNPNPARLGVLGSDLAGFPNGRRLTDDVVDITLQAAAGALVGVNTSLGDGVNVNDVNFRTTFPYLALPHSGGNPWKLNPNPNQGQ